MSGSHRVGYICGAENLSVSNVTQLWQL